MYVFFKYANCIRFCYFCVAHNIKCFIVKFCMLVGYTIDNVQIYFCNFLKLTNRIFEFFKTVGLLIIVSFFL
jgi:hypothetical protein